MRKLLLKLWRFFSKEEGMTWERYYKNKEEWRKRNENDNR